MIVENADDDTASFDVSWPRLQLSVEGKVNKPDRAIRIVDRKVQTIIEQLKERAPSENSVKLFTELPEFVEELRSSVRRIQEESRESNIKIRREIEERTEDSAKEIQGKCHCHNVEHLLAQVDELDPLITDAARDPRDTSSMSEARIASIETEMERLWTIE